MVVASAISVFILLNRDSITVGVVELLNSFGKNPDSPRSTILTSEYMTPKSMADPTPKKSTPTPNPSFTPSHTLTSTATDTPTVRPSPTEKPTRTPSPDEREIEVVKLKGLASNQGLVFLPGSYVDGKPNDWNADEIIVMTERLTRVKKIVDAFWGPDLIMRGPLKVFKNAPDDFPTGLCTQVAPYYQEVKMRIAVENEETAGHEYGHVKNTCWAVPGYASSLFIEFAAERSGWAVTGITPSPEIIEREDKQIVPGSLFYGSLRTQINRNYVAATGAMSLLEKERPNVWKEMHQWGQLYVLKNGRPPKQVDIDWQLNQETSGRYNEIKRRFNVFDTVDSLVIQQPY